MRKAFFYRLALILGLSCGTGTVVVESELENSFPYGDHQTVNTKEKFLIDHQGNTYVYITPGSFTLGDDRGKGNERPESEVTITQGYYMGTQEVRYQDFLQFSQETAFSMPELYGNDQQDFPIVMVSWEDAKAYASWLSEKSGLQFRLPTEAEWEFAASNRGQGASRYPGSEDVMEVARHKGNAEWRELGPGPSRVGSLQPNELGLYDMSGNVWEWCEDDLVRYSSEPKVNPLVKVESGLKVLRGGCFRSDYWGVRYAVRTGFRPDDRFVHNGFRLVAEAE
jgi:sulfatase modifying factor 1